MKNFYHIKSTVIALIVALLSCNRVAAFEHIVDKGETLESIALKYGITTQTIIRSNPGVDDFFYGGMKLDIPYKNSTAASSSAAEKGAEIVSRECEAADEMLDAGEYTKAQKSYSLVIKQLGGKYVCTDAYYGRGIAYYNQGNWKKAIQDFEKVVSDPACGVSVKSHSSTLLARARNKREEQLRQRNEAWAQFFNETVNLAANIAAGSQSATPKNTASGTVSSSGSYTSSSSHTSSHTSSSGSQSSKSGSSSSKSCPSLNYAHGKYYCANSGRCGMCGGDGFMDGSFGQGANAHKCTLCGGTGKCKFCNH